MPLRLTLLIPSLAVGGAERVLARLASYWQDAGHEVTLITLDVESHDTYAVNPGVTRIGLDLMSESTGLVSAIRQNHRRVQLIRESVTASRPDCIVSFIDTMNVLTLLATRKLGKPVIVSERIDPAYHDPGRFWPTLRRWTYPNCRALVVPCEAVGKFFASFVSRDRVHVIPNAVERCRVAVDQERERWIVGVGRLNRQKGFDRLIHSFAELASRHRDWKLILVGEGEQRVELERLTRELRLEGRVRLPGWVADPGCWYERAGIFVLSSRYEAFPNALLEAMAHGCASIAMDCPSGPGEIIRDQENGLLVDPADQAGMTAAIERLIGQPELREQLGTAARNVTNQYSADRVHRMWDQLLDSIVPTGTV